MDKSIGGKSAAGSSHNGTLGESRTVPLTNISLSSCSHLVEKKRSLRIDRTAARGHWATKLDKLQNAPKVEGLPPKSLPLPSAYGAFGDFLTPISLVMEMSLA